MSFINFSHDRSVKGRHSSFEIFNKFDVFVRVKLSVLVDYFSFFYGVERSAVIKAHIRRLGLLYDNQASSFSSCLQLKWTVIYAITHIAYLFICIFFSRIYKRKYFKLVCNDVQSEEELSRIKPITSCFDEKEVCIISEVDLDCDLFYFQKLGKFKNLDTLTCIKHFLIEVFFGLPVIFVLSLFARMNLFVLSTHLNHEMLSGYSIFKNFRADFYFTERMIKSSPLTKSIFSRFGGKRTLTLQKSLVAFDQTSFCLEFDVVFSLYKGSTDLLASFGGNCLHEVPVGSFFSLQRLPAEYPLMIRQPKYDFDILVIGMNVMNNYSRFNCYDGFLDDYYSQIDWLKRILSVKPDLKVAIMHHSSAGVDSIERRLIGGSKIRVLDKNNNSYLAAFSARVCVSYGSTLLYEMCGLGKDCLLFDRGNNNIFIDPKGRNTVVDQIRCETYEAFEKKCLQLLSGKHSLQLGSISRVCEPPYELTEKVKNYFLTQKDDTDEYYRVSAS